MIPSTRLDLVKGVTLFFSLFSIFSDSYYDQD